MTLLWFWVIGVAVILANAAVYRVQAKQHIRRNPELAEGYHTLIKGFVIWGNVPWLVMGIGLLAGGIPSIHHLSRPLDGNPFVLACHASISLIWIRGTHWLFARNGAEMLVQHPGLLNIPIKSPTVVKILWLIVLGCSALGFIMMLTEDPGTGGNRFR